MELSDKKSNSPPDLIGIETPTPESVPFSPILQSTVEEPISSSIIKTEYETPIESEDGDEPPSIIPNNLSSSLENKAFTELSDGEKSKMSYDQIQESIEIDRNKMRPYEYYNAPRR